MNAPRQALVIGEALVDIVNAADGGHAEHPGGSPANVAVALARLGRDVGLATAFADDRLGGLLEEHFRAAGVRLAGQPHVLEHTSSAVATLDESGAASYAFDLDWRLDADALADTLAEGPCLVHTGSLGAVLEPGGAAVADVLRKSVGVATVSYDINARPAATGVSAGLLDQVETLVALADVVKASDEDLETLWPDTSVAESAGRLLELGAGAIVVTWGAKGASCFTPGGVVQSAAQRVEVVDTIGAGDSYCAALLDGLWGHDLLGADRRTALRTAPAGTWQEILDRAGRAAAITVSRAGANPPTLEELGG